MPQNLTLYKLEEQYLILERLSSEDADPASFSIALEQLKGEVAEKVGAVAMHWKNLEATSKAYKEEADRLMAHHRALEHQIDFFKEYLKGTMKSVGLKNVEWGVVRVALQDGQQAVIVDDVGLLPLRYRYQDYSVPLSVVEQLEQLLELLDEDNLIAPYKKGEAEVKKLQVKAAIEECVAQGLDPVELVPGAHLEKSQSVRVR